MALPVPPVSEPAPHPARPHWPALIGLAVLVALMTLPALPRLMSHIVGTGDALVFVWELWWFHHAVFELHAWPLTTDLLFYPAAQMPLIWSTPVNLLPGLLLTHGLGPVVSYNLLVLGGVWLAGVGAYLLAHHLIGRRDAAFLAGAAFTLAPVHLSHVALGQFGVMTLQWLPFCALALLKLYESPSGRRAAWFAATVALVALTDIYVAVFFLATMGTVFTAYQLWRDRAAFLRPGFLGRAALGLVAGLAAAAPFHLPTLKTIGGAQTTLAQAATVHRFGQDLVQVLLPPPQHLLLGFLSRPWADRITNSDNWGFVGWTVLSLAIVAIWRVRGRAVAFWASFAAFAGVLSLGTSLHVAGPTGIPLPYALAPHLPLLQSLRTPGRFMEIAALGLAILAGFGAAWLLARLAPRRRPWAFAGLMALLCLEFAGWFPLPTRTAAIPAYYDALANDPTARGIFELPNGDPSWGYIDHQWMYYQTRHRHPLVYAHTHRIPDGLLDFVQTTPVVRELNGLIATGGVLHLAPELRIGARARLYGEGITHVILHRMPGMLDGARYVALERELSDLFGPPSYRDDTMVVHDLRPVETDSGQRPRQLDAQRHGH